MEEIKTQLFILDVLPLSDPYLLEKYSCGISEQRQEKAKRLKSLHAKAMTVGAELLLRKALSLTHGIDHPLPIVKGEYGKPEIQNYPEIHFNLSHSGNYAVCAVGAHPVGVDIQKMGAPNLKLAKRFFAAEESKWLFSLPAELQKQGFYDLWVIKESYMKYTGKGFGLPMTAFTVKIWGCYPNDVEIEIDQAGITVPVKLKKYDCAADYKLWCCSDYNQFSEHVEWVVIKEKIIE